MRFRTRQLAAVLCLLLTPALSYGQEYFGKNKVSLGDYDWHYIETEHFTIYFDKGSLPVAEFAAKEAERGARILAEKKTIEAEEAYKKEEEARKKQEEERKRKEEEERKKLEEQKKREEAERREREAEEKRKREEEEKERETSVLHLCLY